MINIAVPLNATTNDQFRRITPDHPIIDAKNMTIANKVMYKSLPRFFFISKRKKQ